jgi:hypothetical protein
MELQNVNQSFLERQAIVSLTDATGSDYYTKAGLVPFKRSSDGYVFYVMKPVARQKDLGPPDFQLCKGRRMHWRAEDGWRDFRDPVAPAGEKEALAVTALREGIEELGIRLSAISALLDFGPYDFASARTGKGKRMWLFACEMAKADVLPDAEVAGVTSERRWLSVPEFTAVGRSDHHYILRDMETKLKAHYSLPPVGEGN